MPIIRPTGCASCPPALSQRAVFGKKEKKTSAEPLTGPFQDASQAITAAFLGIFRPNFAIPTHMPQAITELISAKKKKKRPGTPRDACVCVSFDVQKWAWKGS